MDVEKCVTDKTDLPEKRDHFLAWLLSYPVREPKFEKEYASQQGVSARTLRRWKRDPRFLDEWEARSKSKHDSPGRNDLVMDAIFTACQGGDTKACIEYARITGRYTPKKETVQTGRVKLANVSDQELEEMIAAEEQNETGLP